MSNVHDKKDLREIAIKNVGICDYFAPFVLVNKGTEYITNAEVLTQIDIGQFQFVPRNNGSLSFRKKS